ncbi:MAG: hypothetical protein MI892_00765 [Desulfobacterales bacterium]|nr:hypothetical protein [Desulfobacterales bacterium]
MDDIKEKHAKLNRIDLDQILATALAEKEALLGKFPKLKTLQQEIDQDIDNEDSLADKLYTMGVAHARFRGKTRS